MTSLGSLSSFLAGGNLLVGTLPDQWSQIYGLTELDLHGNALSGTFPIDWGTSLSLLTTLDLSDNHLTGYGLPYLYSMEDMVHLDLSNNNFTGGLPYWVTGMPSLKHLDLSRCGLTGSLDSAYANLNMIEFLDLGDNSLTGSLDSSWTTYYHIKHFDVGFNDGITMASTFVDAFLSSQADLEHLDLGGVTGATAFPATAHPTLQHLGLNGVGMAGSWPSSFASDYPSLTSLDIGVNSLSGPQQVSAISGALTGFTYLDISSNSWDPWTLPAGLMTLPALETFICDSCGLTGPFPADWSSWRSSLWLFSVANNALTGPLPADFATCCFELTALVADQNPIGGTLPPEIATSMPELEILSLDGAGLTGTIPGTLSALGSLEELILSGNSLTGTIPVCDLAQSPSLHTINIANNNLNGRLPNSADVFWSNLELFDYSGTNSLSGEHILCNVTYSPSVYIIDFALAFYNAYPDNATIIGPTMLTALRAFTGEPSAVPLPPSLDDPCASPCLPALRDRTLTTIRHLHLRRERRAVRHP